ncbi:MAG: surf-like protein [Cyphobasidiales sp. Tagirdzhanova-0007]|nr:MAG: surf-like protein [Cyphobasidiales sp. Tagirdzhanova-0007]
MDIYRVNNGRTCEESKGLRSDKAGKDDSANDALYDSGTNEATAGTTGFFANAAPIIEAGRNRSKKLRLGDSDWAASIKRLRWKINLIQELDDKLSREPMRLPSKIDTSAIPEFAYRKVETSGHFDHSREVLLGPKVRDSVLGYQVVTPLVREENNPSSTILVNRGHVSREKKNLRDRPESLLSGTQNIVGMLRDQEKRNAFSPVNSPEKREYQFMDIAQMAAATGTQPVLVDEIFEGNAGEMKQMITHGIPVGRAATIELRNQHATYAVTWYALSAATSVMLWRLFRRPPKRNAFSRFNN